MLPFTARHAVDERGDPLRPLALELRHLRLVLAIEEESGVTRAGERLHLTQSALSHQLKEVEARLGVSLFLRVKSRMVLTEAGRQVLAAARRLLPEVVGLEEELRARAAGRRGAVRLAIERYTCYDWLAPLLREFATHHPGVGVELATAAAGYPVQAVREGAADLALVTGAQEGLVARGSFEDELLLLAAPEHRLANRRFVRPAELAGERLMLTPGPRESALLTHFLLPAGAPPRDVLLVELTAAALAIARAGLGVTAMPRWAVNEELARGELVALALGENGLRETWSVVGRRGSRDPASLGALASLLASLGAATLPSRAAG